MTELVRNSVCFEKSTYYDTSEIISSQMNATVSNVVFTLTLNLEFLSRDRTKGVHHGFLLSISLKRNTQLTKGG